MGTNEVSNEAAIALTLLSRTAICAATWKRLWRRLRPNSVLRSRVLDVDADDVLEAKWGELVPVLLHGDGTLPLLPRHPQSPVIIWPNPLKSAP